MMSKKLYALLLPVLAVAAFAIAPAAAQAEFHWYTCHEVAKETGKFEDEGCTKEKAKSNFELTRAPFEEGGKLFLIQVITWGKLEFKVGGVTVVCKVLDAGNVWNAVLAAPGKDNIEVFVNYECSSAACPEGVTLTAEGLPWSSVLAAGPVDKISGIQVTLNCKGVLVETFKGELSPKIVNGAGVRKPTVAEFTAATGELAGPVNKAKVEGKDKVLGFENEEMILVKNP